MTTKHDERLLRYGLAAVGLIALICAIYFEEDWRGKHTWKKLNALLPQYLEKLPTDIITGQPLKYRLKTGGQFVLYSVGWNQKDDGGVPGPKKDGTPDPKLGDWVWAIN